MGLHERALTIRMMYIVYTRALHPRHDSNLCNRIWVARAVLVILDTWSVCLLLTQSTWESTCMLDNFTENATALLAHVHTRGTRPFFPSLGGLGTRLAPECAHNLVLQARPVWCITPHVVVPVECARYRHHVPQIGVHAAIVRV